MPTEPCWPTVMRAGAALAAPSTRRYAFGAVRRDRKSCRSTASPRRLNEPRNHNSFTERCIGAPAAAPYQAAIEFVDQRADDDVQLS
jgi:hypothetical protein